MPDLQTPTGRWRVVAWIVAVTALGLTLLLFGASMLLRHNASQAIEHGMTQEVGELRRFAETASDPATGERFDSASRLVEVYLGRQQAGPAELIVGGIVGEATHQQTGPEAPRFESLDEATRNTVLKVNSRGTHATLGAGEISWANVEVQSGTDTGYVAVVAFHEPTQQRIREQVAILGAIAAIALLATGAVAWFVSGRIMRHTDRFEREVEQAIREKELPQFDEDGGPEYTRLAVAANKLLAKADRAVARERVFSEDLTHELRTPLAILQGGLENPGETLDQRDRTRAEMLEEVERLRRFVAALVVLQKVEDPDHVRPEVTVPADEFLDTFVSARQEDLADEGHPVRVELGEVQPDLQVTVDERRLQQLLDELLSNALRASEPGASVRINASATDDGHVAIDVVDEGRGIPPAELEVVRRRLARASNDPAPGAGLGLAVAERLALAHSGTLRLFANPAGRGTIARVELPRA